MYTVHSSLSTDPTYSTLSQILIQQFHIFNNVKLSHLVLIPRSNSHLIQQSHLFNIVTNSVVYLVYSHLSFNSPNIFKSVANSLLFSNSTVYLVQQTKPIQYYHKFSCISYSISLSVQTYSQIHLSYPIPQSNLIQQSHIFNSVTNSIVFSFYTYSTVPFIQKCRKFTSVFNSHISFNRPNLFNIITNSVVYLVYIHISFNSPNIFKSFTNSLVLSNSTV